ncbi:hypothetical protein, partial [Kocuria rhizophila]|uniref:hypothetical protein n=1 Tax=Kocuria rhizophila TaxID=72000 RepID=UPI001C92E542
CGVGYLGGLAMGKGGEVYGGRWKREGREGLMMGERGGRMGERVEMGREGRRKTRKAWGTGRPTAEAAHIMRADAGRA